MSGSIVITGEWLLYGHANSVNIYIISNRKSVECVKMGNCSTPKGMLSLF